jgi:pimeloyl-[acyl-carrier protein] methyl ester esterase
MIQMAALALASTLVASAVTPAPAARMFPGSDLVVESRFSDEIIGHGPDLVLIPGLASSRETWKATVERLKGRYRLHLIQVSGFAGEPSRANASGDVLVPTAQAIDSYLVARDLTPATVVGHSMGATMTLYLLEHHPEHYRKALLVDCLPFFGVLMGGPAATTASVRPIAEKFKAAMVKTDDASRAMSEKQIRAMVTAQEGQDQVIGWSRISDRAVVAQAMEEDILLDLRPNLGDVATPVTVFYPDNVSVGAPKGAMDAFYGAAFAPLPNKRLTRFDDSRPFIMFDQPGKFAVALDDFLTR